MTTRQRWSPLFNRRRNAKRDGMYGNTFINEGMNSRFFHITPAGEIVWEM